MAAGIFLRIRGGVGRLGKKTELIKCAVVLGAGMGWGDARRGGAARSGGGRVGGARPQGATAMDTATGATGAQPGPTGRG
ncbi:hypothetical protein [Corynebacterium matruchotii]|uniref:hypothetical protein n=1 Tax=Corynebacterium matruchotii TaxID=43768 RepID=UPI0028ECA5E4|nr:hypothetical protein [Corynebacterium matruchotii]